MSYGANRSRSNTNAGQMRDHGHEVHHAMRSGGDAEITDEVMLRVVARVIRDRPDPGLNKGPSTTRMLAFMRLCVREGI